MSITYESISKELEDIYKKRKFRLSLIENIYLPSEKYLIFKKEKISNGLNISWWGIPIAETYRNDIYFLTRGN